MTKKLKAITLVETLVYIAIFSMFMLVIMQFLISTQINQDKIYKELELEMNRIFLTNHLEDELRYNFNFDKNNSTLDENDSYAVFLNNQETLIYRIENGDFILEKGSDITKLTNNKATIESFHLETINTAEGEIAAIKINIGLEHKDNSRVTNNFSTLIKLAYEEI